MLDWKCISPTYQALCAVRPLLADCPLAVGRQWCGCYGRHSLAVGRGERMWAARVAWAPPPHQMAPPSPLQ